MGKCNEGLPTTSCPLNREGYTRIGTEPRGLEKSERIGIREDVALKERKGRKISSDASRDYDCVIEGSVGIGANFEKTKQKVRSTLRVPNTESMVMKHVSTLAGSQPR